MAIISFTVDHGYQINISEYGRILESLERKNKIIVRDKTIKLLNEKWEKIRQFNQDKSK